MMVPFFLDRQIRAWSFYPKQRISTFEV
jgi:hypothetical protein